MSVYIHHEIFLFFQSVCTGAMLLLCYDCLRIVRNIIPHGAAARCIEDVLYWLAAGLFIFIQVYRTNQGTLRGFLFLGMGTGAILCVCTISAPFVKIGTLILEIPVKFVKFLIKRLLFLLKRCKIFVYKSADRYILGENRRIRRSKRGGKSEKVSEKK